MSHRTRTVATLCGVLALGACDDESEPQGDTGSTGVASTGVTAGSSSSGSTGDLEGSSTGAGSSTASSEAGTSSQGGETTTGESDSGTAGPGDPFDCETLGGVLITEFQAELPVFTVGADDVITAPLGTICMLPTETSWVLRLQFGPMEGPDWSSTLRIQVADAGTYDLTADFGEPGSGASEPNALSYALQEGASTSGFDTSNQAADGTLQVDNWPEVSGNDISIRGDGNIAGMDGWRFQFSISAVLP